jgi:hypothetical protein
MDYGNDEPQLEEMLSDPIVRALMRRDEVAESNLRGLIAEARFRLFAAVAGKFAECRGPFATI